MVRALNVYSLGVAAAELVEVVGDVRHKIGVGAVSLIVRKAVAEVLKRCGAKPERAILFVGIARVDDRLNGFLNSAGGVKR